MATHTWLDQTYDQAVMSFDAGPQRETLYVGVAGVDGVQTIRKGFRGLQIVLRGEYKAETLADCFSWLRTQQQLIQGDVGTLSVYDAADHYDYCELSSFKRLSTHRSSSGYGLRWEAVFLQLRPNDDDLDEEDEE